jgi:ABC-type multidrug transport system permease subunit
MRRIHNCFSAIGGQQVNCSAIEFVNITPPSGQTCGQYMNPYISSAGGYLTNPDATSACNFCGVRTTDDLMAVNYNIFYSHRWRNSGFMVAFIVFNVRFFRGRFVYLLTPYYLGILHVRLYLSIPHTHW